MATVLVPAGEGRVEDWGAGTRRLDQLREFVRCSLRVGRLLLDEVLTEQFRNDDPSQYRKLASKAGGELAMLLRMARRALTDDGDAREITDLARDLARHARAPHLRRSLVTRPSRAPMYALAHLCLSELGVPDESFDRLARTALTSSVRWANERVAYRMLDAAWTRHIAFGDAELSHPAIALSPIGAGVDLLEATTEDAYAFTHALPYATDFGRLPLPLPAKVQRLVELAEAIVVKSLDEDDLDLLAEVLMAPAILRVPWTPTLEFGWLVLERVWNEFGFVPGPGLPDPVEGETRAQRVRRVLGTTYHTSFAAGLCCATLIVCDALPPESYRCETRDAEPPAGKGTMWRLAWNECSGTQQDGLVVIRLGFQLRRGVERMDVAAIRDVVLSAAEMGRLEHPLFAQALELLERLGC